MISEPFHDQEMFPTTAERRLGYLGLQLGDMVSMQGKGSG